MADTNIQGVDLATGKLSLSLPLFNLSGPNKFGESLNLQYSTLGLLKQIKTWNEECFVDILGLWWASLLAIA